LSQPISRKAQVMSNLKVIAVPTSPYAARLRIQSLEKALNVEWQYPAAGVSLAEHAALNPFARTPILLDGANCLIESAAIAEYFEDLHPEPSLRGSSPLETARVRGFVGAVDHYLFPLLLRLRSSNADDPALPALLAELHRVLGNLEALSGNGKYVITDQLTLADCALMPACFYLDFFLARLQQADFRLQHSRLGAWWLEMLRRDSVQAVIAGLNEALQRRS